MTKTACPPSGASIAAGRRHAGRRADLSGRAAEDAVAAHYAHRGGSLVARRWRGSCGEIDLVIRDGEDLAFVEVKRGRSFARAAERLSAAQIGRIMATASEFLGTQPAGQLTPMRLDLATVDAIGRVDVLENAFGP